MKSKFIKLTQCDYGKTRVNVSHIIMYIKYRDSDSTNVMLTDYKMIVKETPEEIDELLNAFQPRKIFVKGPRP